MNRLATQKRRASLTSFDSYRDISPRNKIPALVEHTLEKASDVSNTFFVIGLAFDSTLLTYISVLFSKKFSNEIWTCSRSARA
jgi:hypothetical protein